MKNQFFLVLSFPAICTLSTCLSAQDIKMTSAFPELKKPIVLMPATESTQPPSTDYTIVADCSPTKPGVAEVIIRRPAQMKSTDNIRVDVTVFKDGFANNKFAVLYKSKKMKAFEQEKFDRAQLTKALDLNTATLSKAEQNNQVIYKLEGLESGLNYFWRISKEGKDSWEATEVIRIEAPTCPVDSSTRQ